MKQTANCVGLKLLNTSASPTSSRPWPAKLTARPNCAMKSLLGAARKIATAAAQAQAPRTSIEEALLKTNAKAAPTKPSRKSAPSQPAKPSITRMNQGELASPASGRAPSTSDAL